MFMATKPKFAFDYQFKQNAERRNLSEWRISLVREVMASISLRISPSISFHLPWSGSSHLGYEGGSRALNTAVVFSAVDTSSSSRVGSAVVLQGCRSGETVLAARRFRPSWRRRNGKRLRSRGAAILIHNLCLSLVAQAP